MLKKIMSIYYKIILIVTIMYVILAICLKDVNNAYVGPLIFGCIFMFTALITVRFAKNISTTVFWEFIFEIAGLLIIAWILMYFSEWIVDVLYPEPKIIVKQWNLEVFRRALSLTIDLFIVTIGLVVANILNVFKRKKVVENE